MEPHSVTTIEVRITDPGPLAGVSAGDFFFFWRGEVRAGSGPLMAEVVYSAWPLVQAKSAAISDGDLTILEGRTESGTCYQIEPIRSGTQSVAFLDSLPDPLVKSLRAASHMRTYRTGEDIIVEGSSASCLFMIDRGQAEVVRAGQRLAVLLRGSVFGEMSILTGRPTVATVRSLGMSVILAIEKPLLEDLLLREPRLAAAFSSLLASRLQSIDPSRSSDLQAAGIYGTLSMIEPADLVQSMLARRSTGALTFTREDEVGRMWFLDGQVVGAQCGDDLAEEAFTSMIQWHDGKFSFRHSEATPQGPIECDTMSLLMESMRIIDEASKGGGDH